MNTFFTRYYFLLLSASLLLALSSCQPKAPANTAYLFAYFTGNGPGQEQVHYAISRDGYQYRALNNNQPVIDSKDISSTGGVRDPHILRGQDGMFYMVLTDLYVPDMGWENTAMVMLKSKDLISWDHTVVDIPKTFPATFGNVYRVWAPQTIYDQVQGKYMLYWSMIQPGGRDIIYYAYANADFTGLESEPKQLLYKEGACIDGDIVFKEGKYFFFFKNEDDDAKGIMLAISDKINEGYEVQEGFVDQTDSQVEGSGVFKLIGSENYILMYDMYTSGKYQFCKTDDLQHFNVIDENIEMNFHPRHGSVMQITEDELNRLVEKWGTESFFIKEATNPDVKAHNIEFGEGSLILPVRPGTNMARFDPMLKTAFAAEVSPSGEQDFTNGPVSYTVSFAGKTKKVDVSLQSAGNPVLDGFYADPEIIFSEQYQKYYLYPTSDGFYKWSGTFFEVFESDDLVHWQNKGTILDLKKDVDWADGNAWAPCAIETKTDDGYKYYYYFTAAKKIGVAVGDQPTGPFVDSGEALIDFKLEGINRGIEIDPDVFHDPQSGKNYLYWGNGYMAAAELNEDMISIKKESIKDLTPDGTFREGTEVFFRNGIYYFLWSENDTRSPDYRVRYATAESPTGPLNIPKNNLVIEKDTAQGIYGTGHNSVVYTKANDQWYIVYHRFNKPNGITMGRAAGYNREVCIDKLDFDEEGRILIVSPSLEGIVVKESMP